MQVAPVGPNGINVSADGFRKAFDELAKTPNPIDAVSLSQEAIQQSEEHIQFSLDIKTKKIEDQISSLASALIG